MELIKFFKTITLIVSTLSTSINFALQQINPPPPPASPSESAQEFIPPTTPVAPIKPRAIDVRSIVGIFCAFTNINPESDLYNTKKYQRGSGVIINKDGFILTNRDVIDPAFYNPDWDNYKLDSCQAGPAPKEFHIPSDEEIRRINPFIQVPVLSYAVEPVFAPYEVYISDYEKDWIDFALLLITGLTPDAPVFGVTKLPKEFPYTPILISEIPKNKDKIMNFGYPVGTTLGLHAAFNTIFMQGLLSHVTKLWTGDQRFKDELFLLESSLDTEGTAEGGRVGGPILYKGYVVGTHIYRQDRSLNIYNLGIQPIVDILKSNGVQMFDDPY